MWKDEIVEEVRKHREACGAEPPTSTPPADIPDFTGREDGLVGTERLVFISYKIIGERSKNGAST